MTKPIDEPQFTLPMEQCEIGQDGQVRISRAQVLELARAAALTKVELEPPYPRIVSDDGGARTIDRGPDLGEIVVSKFVNDDPKYGVRTYGLSGAVLYNLETGQEIPRDEPIAIFRAKDIYAASALEAYARIVENAGTSIEPMTRDSAAALWMRFVDFANNHPERMRKPT